MTHRAAGRRIRRVRASDLPQISALIRNTLLVTNLRDYSLETIRALMSTFSTESVGSLARRREMFVCEETRRLAGVLGLEGAEVFTFFVAPDRQGSGVGRALLGYVEELARGRQVPSLRVSASLTAVGFLRAPWLSAHGSHRGWALRPHGRTGQDPGTATREAPAVATQVPGDRDREGSGPYSSKPSWSPGWATTRHSCSSRSNSAIRSRGILM